MRKVCGNIPQKSTAACQVRLLLLPICVPSHNFFRNFLAKNFVDSIIIVTFALSYLAESSIWAKAGWTYIHKGVTVRFGFDAIRTSQLPNVCQEQSNGDAPWDVSYIQPLLAHSI